MHCPVDQASLIMTERSGVEIDYCPKCRGVWLDRGELDKILAQSAPAAGRRSRDDDDDGDLVSMALGGLFERILKI
jgi:uncharacterized protein